LLHDFYEFATHRLGTERARTNMTGTACETIRSLPFGDGQTNSDSCGDSAGDVSPLHFTGKERDAESGLDYFGARYMSGAQGRFTSPDPTRQSVDKANPQTWNRYSYTLNNPHAYVDKNGLWPTPIHEAMLDSIFGGVLSSWQVKYLKSVSWGQDNPFGPGQDPQNSNWHAMCTPAQHGQCAGGIADYISMNLASAKRLGDFAGLTENSLLYFGKAAHTLSDLGSPYHVADDGTPFTWYGTFGQGGLSHIFGEDLFGAYGDYGWLRIGASIRNIVGGFFSAFPEEATTLFGNPNSAAQRAIENYVTNALRPYAFGGSLTPGQEDAVRLCALGNPAACGFGPQP
jgi:RHS repeat-associated protein